ncbi:MULTISPECIES: LapA family protein [Jonquetella]|uniref:Lipopolysaccharide assembly protein A domain-containing protein n=1 Tax=Jonquetella anthropi DSM 22815 TaxID=885272 RepID=H0UMM6_9BACT|nr:MULTISPECIES: LapA family protein [Jonquetella]EHM13729.1 Protein of unknown function (DUF1049) [Jonquetella anthropi DSM 22815]
MKSYGIGLGLTAVLAAIFAVQNPDMISVRWLAWEFALPQGLWEVLMFGLGVLLMGVFAVVAGWENRYRVARELSRSKLRIAALEKEREALLSAAQAAGTTEEEINFIEGGLKV